MFLSSLLDLCFFTVARRAGFVTQIVSYPSILLETKLGKYSFLFSLKRCSTTRTGEAAQCNRSFPLVNSTTSSLYFTVLVQAISPTWYGNIHITSGTIHCDHHNGSTWATPFHVDTKCHTVWDARQSDANNQCKYDECWEYAELSSSSSSGK